VLGVEAAQFWLGQACPTADEAPAVRSDTAVNNAKNKDTAFSTSLERRFPIIGLCLSQANLLFLIRFQPGSSVTIFRRSRIEYRGLLDFGLRSQSAEMALRCSSGAAQNIALTGTDVFVALLQ